MKSRFVFVLAVALLSVSSIAHAQTWQNVAAFPGSARAGAVMFAIGDTIYAGGGEGSSGATDSDFYAYSVKSQKWMKEVFRPSQGGAQPVTRVLGASLVIGNIAYVGLGRKQTSQGLTALADWWEYDPKNGWTHLPDFPGTPRYQSYAFTVGSLCYVGGGNNTGGGNLTEFYSFNPSGQTWTGLAQPSFGPITDAATFSLGLHAYVACGSQGFANPVMQSLWRYNPSGDTWTQMADYPGQPREGCSGFALNGKGYVGFGTLTNIICFSDMYSYDTAHNTWSKVSAPNEGSVRCWVGTAVAGNMAFVGLGANPPASTYYNDLSSLTLGAPPSAVATPDAEGISFYPNPAKDFLEVTMPEDWMSVDATITNALGVQMLHASLSRGVPLDIRKLPPGYYTATLSSGPSRNVLRFMKE